MKISIIIPCYNVENTIEATVNSVLKQSYENYEMLLIDDGSTDNTMSMLRKCANKDNRIKIFWKKNGGVSSARNLGIEKSIGEIIYFLDGDDQINSELFRNAIDIFGNNNIDCYSFGYAKYQNSKIIKTYQNDKYDNKKVTGEKFTQLFLNKQVNQSICSMMIRKEIIDKNNIKFNENTKYGEDQEFQVRVNITSNYIFYSAKIYFRYIYRVDSAINKVISLDSFDVYERLRNYLPQKLYSSYYSYRCYIFIFYFLKAWKMGVDKESLKKLLDTDYVFNVYKINLSKYGIITYLFKVIYFNFGKKKIKKKYQLL